MKSQYLKKIRALDCKYLGDSKEIKDFFRFDHVKTIEKILDEKCDKKIGKFTFNGEKWEVNSIIYSDPESPLDPSVFLKYPHSPSRKIFEGDYHMFFKEYVELGRPKEILVG